MKKKTLEIGFLLLDMMNCPDCDIKMGTKDSKFCKTHLTSGMYLKAGFTR